MKKRRRAKRKGAKVLTCSFLTFCCTGAHFSAAFFLVFGRFVRGRDALPIGLLLLVRSLLFDGVREAMCGEFLYDPKNTTFDPYVNPRLDGFHRFEAEKL